MESSAEDIVYSSLFTGVSGNYLRPSIVAAGLDPDHLPEGDVTKMDFGSETGAKAWKDIWGCGQGIDTVDAVLPTSDLVARYIAQYHAARARLCA